MYVCTFSTIAVPSNSLISKAHVYVSSTFFVTSYRPFSKARMTKVRRACSLRSLVFLEVESSLHFGIGEHNFFLRVGAIMNLRSFDLMVNS